MATEVALGTKVFTRVGKLEGLLNSLPELISTVYIADDGKPNKEKNELYSQEYHFEIQVIDLEFDAGLGRGRREIVNKVEEDYLLVVDPDHRVPRNIDILLSQLEQMPEYGGIAGAIVEPEVDRLYLEGQDFSESGTMLIRSPTINRKSVEMVAGYPFVTFDFIPNAALFRIECLEDYCWDPEYTIEMEHVDFYIGHWKRTEWQFGVCPSVIFEHYPGGDTEYSEHRGSDVKERNSKNYFFGKWGYDDESVLGWEWYDGGRVIRPPLTYVQDVIDIYQADGFSQLSQRGIEFLKDHIDSGNRK